MEENRKKKIISYFNYAAKQYTIIVLETRSKRIPPLTKQRDFNRRILVKYFSNIRKAPFGRVLKTRDFGSMFFSSSWFLFVKKYYPKWVVRFFYCFEKLDLPCFCLY